MSGRRVVVSLSIRGGENCPSERLVGGRENGFRTDRTSGKWGFADSRTCELHREAASEVGAGRSRGSQGQARGGSRPVKSCDGEQVRVQTRQIHQQRTRQQATARGLPYPTCLKVLEWTPSRKSRAVGQRPWRHQMCQCGSLRVRNGGDDARCECWGLYADA
jgi:hypothetical protein